MIWASNFDSISSSIKKLNGRDNSGGRTLYVHFFFEGQVIDSITLVDRDVNLVIVNMFRENGTLEERQLISLLVSSSVSIV